MKSALENQRKSRSRELHSTIRHSTDALPDAATKVRMMEPTWPLPEEEEERHRIHWKFVDKCKGDWDLSRAGDSAKLPGAEVEEGRLFGVEQHVSAFRSMLSTPQIRRFQIETVSLCGSNTCGRLKMCGGCLSGSGALTLDLFM